MDVTNGMGKLEVEALERAETRLGGQCWAVLGAKAGRGGKQCIAEQAVLGPTSGGLVTGGNCQDTSTTWKACVSLRLLARLKASVWAKVATSRVPTCERA